MSSVTKINKISGIIITYNEEKNIERCLKSLVSVCDEIVVVDSFSKDATQDICAKYEVKFIQNAFQGHIEQKNYALSQAKYEHVLSLDADEALSDQLKESILECKNNGLDQAYKFNRFTNFCGQWIKHCDWYPDTKVRLWNKNFGHWGGTNPHDSVILSDTTPKHLKGDILHYSYYTLSEFFERSLKYAKISARAMHEQGRKAPLSKVLGSTLFRFFKDYVIKLGFLDGLNGLIICGTNSHTTFIKYIYLKTLNKGKSIDG